MSSLEIVSPIPPIMTGTASYMKLIGKRIGHLLGAVGADVRIVTDADAWSRDGLGDALPKDFCGMPVVSHRDVAIDPSSDTTRIYFLANNDKHVFIHEMLARQSAHARGRVISVLHDPSMFMVHRHMARHPELKFDPEKLIDTTRSQLGRSADTVIRARINEWLPDIVDFGLHCMGPAIQKSDEVWTHSLYGANRARFENDFTGARCTRIRVCAHPTDTDVHVAERHTEAGVFNIGVFGWVTPPKRLDSVLRGLSHALDRMDAAQRARVRLNVVGKRTPKGEYDPEDLALRLGLGDYIRFIDYPSTEEFEARIAASDLIFNLRYPSCGESSGTLASAGHSGVRVVTSRYQAFREGQGVWRFVGVAEPYETLEISEAIMDAMAEWQQEKVFTPAVSTHPIATIDKVIVEEALKLSVKR